MFGLKIYVSIYIAVAIKSIKLTNVLVNQIAIALIGPISSKGTLLKGRIAKQSEARFQTTKALPIHLSKGKNRESSN